MSTKLTKLAADTQAADVPLAMLLVRAEQWTMESLSRLMAERGHATLSRAHLKFLSNLDCGITHAALVARRMGVTRQAVYRTTRELQALGVLVLEDDPRFGNQKIVRMTDYGQTVVLDARETLKALEASLKRRLGASTMNALVDSLAQPWGPTLGAPPAD